MTDLRYYAFATISVKPEFFADAKQAILAILPQTLAEEGCEMFTLHTDYDGVDYDEAEPILYLYEIFADEAAFNFHHAQAYTKQVFEKYKTWLAGEVIIKRLKRLPPEI
ncbi:putative quinol monooxygenase [Thalassoporum mexicanum]|uniref:putative quinol monooxygenase n=1 Tax=Thalassoporum mexicanum TaxID=3457544 RepID=UPI0012E9BF24|nr:antibiotic biosynthesis monooxygenase [Pseudanabaena sp. PCC 7367]